MKLATFALLVGAVSAQQLSLGQVFPSVRLARPGDFSGGVFQKNQNNQFQAGPSFSSQEQNFQFQSTSSFTNQGQDQFQTGPSFNSQGQSQFQTGSSSITQGQTNFEVSSSLSNQGQLQSGNFVSGQEQANQFQSRSSFNGQEQISQFQPSSSFSNQGQNSQFQSGSSFRNQEQKNRFQQTSNFNIQTQRSQFQESGDLTFAVNGEFEPLNLPAGARLLLGNIDTSFQCADRPYGYYADQSNDCRVFHVCNPYLFSDGRIETKQYSFMCGEGSIFDQKELTCVEQFAALPCSEASNFYSRNEEFGRPEEKL